MKNEKNGKTGEEFDQLKYRAAQIKTEYRSDDRANKYSDAEIDAVYSRPAREARRNERREMMEQAKRLMLMAEGKIPFDEKLCRARDLKPALTGEREADLAEIRRVTERVFALEDAIQDEFEKIEKCRPDATPMTDEEREGYRQLCLSRMMKPEIRGDAAATIAYLHSEIDRGVREHQAFLDANPDTIEMKKEDIIRIASDPEKLRIALAARPKTIHGSPEETRRRRSASMTNKLALVAEANRLREGK
jgi:hypothetical protein